MWWRGLLFYVGGSWVFFVWVGWILLVGWVGCVLGFEFGIFCWCIIWWCCWVCLCIGLLCCVFFWWRSCLCLVWRNFGDGVEVWMCVRFCWWNLGWFLECLWVVVCFNVFVFLVWFVVFVWWFFWFFCLRVFCLFLDEGGYVE